MAWPSDWSDGEVLTHTRLNQWTAAQKVWPDNVNAGGYNLSGVSSLTATTANLTNCVATRNDGSYQYTLIRGISPARTYGIAVEGVAGGLVIDDVTANAQRFRITAAGYIHLFLPTSSAGVPSGALWNDGGTVKVV
jgi:hypothetical protein